MINVTYSSQQLLSLFGRQGGGQPVDATAAKTITELAKRAEAAMAAERKTPATPASSVLTPTGDGRRETYEDYERRAVEARALIAEREAVEKVFAEENGWERKATPASVSGYNYVMGREATAYGIGSHMEAIEFASRMLDNAWDLGRTANRVTATLADPAQVEQVAAAKGLSAHQATAMLEDERLAATMQATIERRVFDKTFEVTGGPLMGKRNGFEFANNVEVRWQGQLVLTVEGHGERVTRYDQAGQVSSTSFLGGFQDNQPSAYMPPWAAA